MKRPIHTFIIILVITLLNITQMTADIWQPVPYSGGGEWSNPDTWVSMIDGGNGVPQPGDVIFINGSDIVTITVTVDLSTIHDDTPTEIYINGNGILLFTPPGANCELNNCDIDLILDTGSQIVVDSDANEGYGIRNEGPGAGQRDIIIGGESVLPTSEWPYGPGTLPEPFALPVALSAFTGTELEHSVLLRWETASEENTDVFVLERSANGRDGFNEVGFVSATGNSDEARNYKFEDRNPLEMAYYRLKIIDFDGSFEYSQVIAVEKSFKNVSDFEVYPIPVQNELTISLNSDKNSEAMMSLTNYLGQKVLEKQIELNEGNNQYTLEWNQLDNSVYFLIIETEKERLVKKVF